MMLSKQCPDGQPAPPGHAQEQTETAMTFFRFETAFDRFAPVFLLALGLVATVATAGLGL